MADHIKAISSKDSKSIDILLRIRTNIPNDVLLTLYYTLIEPYFSYCNIIWSTHFSKHLDQLYHTQKKVIRIIANAKWIAHTAPLFRDFQLLSIFLSILLFIFINCKHVVLCIKFPIVFFQLFLNSK